MKLLIVDDDLPFRERLTRSMEKKGFEVTSSPSFKDSIVKFRSSILEICSPAYKYSQYGQ